MTDPDNGVKDIIDNLSPDHINFLFDLSSCSTESQQIAGQLISLDNYIHIYNYMAMSALNITLA